MIKHYFNMIEIALAMAVVTLGIVGVLALLPPALDSSKEASGEVYAQQAASTMIEYLKFFLKRGYTNFTNTISEVNTFGDFPSNAEKTAGTTLWNTNAVYYQNGKTSLNPTTEPLLFCVTENGTVEPKAYIRIRKYIVKEVNGYTDNNDVSCMRYYIEISWPVEKSYANRKKQTFIYDVCNVN